MTSQKSSSARPQSPPPPTAKEPKRKRGIARVAKLLDAGAAVFAEQGYKAATMTEIAARAGAPIGSLYQFFPNKDVLADALIARYAEHVEAALDRIRAEARALDGTQLADRLLDVLVTDRAQSGAEPPRCPLGTAWRPSGNPAGEPAAADR